MMKHACLGAALTALLATPSGATDRPWCLIGGRNVTVVGQQSPKTLRSIAVEIEQFRVALGDLVRGARLPSGMPTEVYTFDTAKALEPFVPLYQGRPAALRGYCHCGTGSEGNFIAVSLDAYGESSRIIFHEYTHLLVRGATRGAPAWLNEGLAEYYSTFRLAGDGRQAEIGRPVERHVTTLRQGFVPVAELLAVEQSSALYNESDRRSVFYAEAWALTHYLLVERPDGGAAINRYLTALTDGQDPVQAFPDAFGMATAEVDAQLRQYVRRPVFRSLSYRLPTAVGVEQPEGARMLTMIEAGARLGEVQMRVGRVGEAAVRIEAAAAAGPDVAPAQLALALLRLGQHRDEEAWKPLEHAAALAPDDYLTQYTLALALLRKDVEPGRSRDATERAHAALTRALAANPESADALSWQTFADLQLNTRLPEARAAITRAIALAPARLDYRIQLAEVCIRQGEAGEARRLLTELAAVKGDEATAARARAILAALARRERMNDRP